MKKELIVNGRKVEFEVLGQSTDQITLSLNGKSFTVLKNGNSLSLKDQRFSTEIFRHAKTGESHMQIGEMRFVVEKVGRGANAGAGGSDYLSPMPGKVFKVLVKEGDNVKSGDPLLVMEAMKMEHTIKASSDGVVDKIFYQAGEQVDAKKQLIEVKP